MSDKLTKALKENESYMEKVLAGYLEADFVGDSELAEAMKYSLLCGGKRIRAFLVNHFCMMFGGNIDACAPFASAIEMIHAFSLIHDDLPCMDDDDMRRGRPSCHKAFGEATALLAGDTLLAYAFEVMSKADVSDFIKVKIIKEFAYNSGALGMAGGQFIDLSEGVQSFSDLKRLYNLKTGALIKASCLAGYYAASGEIKKSDIDNIEKYADGIGLAFQIIDDLLDVYGDESKLGKPIGSDAENGKKTALAFMSSDEARMYAKELTAKSVDAISGYEGNEVLAELALWLLNRMY